MRLPIEIDGGSEFVRIRLSVPMFQKLRRWASVGRTIDASRQAMLGSLELIEKLMPLVADHSEFLAEKDRLDEQINHSVGELTDLKQPLSECGSACVSLHVESGLPSIEQHPTIVLEELAAAVREVGTSVLGLPCFCDSPEMHSESCVRVRALVQRAEFVLGKRA